MSYIERYASELIPKLFPVQSPMMCTAIYAKITFEHLMKYVKEHNISGTACKDEIEYGMGSVYPTPGGLKENVYWFLGEDVLIMQIEGEGHIYHYLEKNKEIIAIAKIRKESKKATRNTEW